MAIKGLSLQLSDGYKGVQLSYDYTGTVIPIILKNNNPVLTDLCFKRSRFVHLRRKQQVLHNNFAQILD